jgi:hypothetical protein
VGIDNLDRVGSEIQASPPLPDELARQEANKFNGDKRRAESTKQHIHNAVIVGIWASAILMLGIMVFRTIYLFLPKDDLYLGQEQLQTIDGVINAIWYGIIGAMATTYIDKSLSRDTSKND